MECQPFQDKSCTSSISTVNGPRILRRKRREIGRQSTRNFGPWSRTGRNTRGKMLFNILACIRRKTNNGRRACIPVTYHVNMHHVRYGGKFKRFPHKPNGIQLFHYLGGALKRAVTASVSSNPPPPSKDQKNVLQQCNGSLALCWQQQRYATVSSRHWTLMTLVLIQVLQPGSW